MSDKLNELERAVINEYFKQLDLAAHRDGDLLAKIEVKERSYTGMGFMTEISTETILRVGTPDFNYIGGNVGAKLNNQFQTSYIFYVKNGLLEAIEGYSDSANWPEEILSIETYREDFKSVES